MKLQLKPMSFKPTIPLKRYLEAEARRDDRPVGAVIRRILLAACGLAQKESGKV